MTIAITHKFVSAKGDGTDTTLVRPSNWNDTHTIQCASGVVLGRQSVGSGNAEELTCSSAAATLLSQPDIASILSYLGITLPTTGDFKPTLKTSADTGWVMCNDGTIGSASSGATTRANADCQALFTLLYNNLNDTNAPVQTSAGSASTRAAQGTASAAWAANCRISLTKMLGRSLAFAGSGSGLTIRTLGDTLGVESTTLVTANLPPYTPAGTITNGAITITNTSALRGVAGDNNNNGGGGGAFAAMSGGVSLGATQATSTFTGTAQGGTSTPFTNMQPTVFVNVMVKL